MVSKQKTPARKRLFNALTLLFCLLPALASARLFKWVDENGNVHYSDTVPPQYVDRKREEMKESGVRTQVIDEAKSKEQLEAERKQAELEKKEEENRRRTEAYHRNLLASYRDERDLIATRDRNLDSIQVSINFVEANLNGFQLDLEDLIKEAASYERSGKPTPQLLKTQIGETRRKIDEANTFIEEKKAEQQTIRDQFNQDLELYRLLTGAQRSKDTP